MPEPAVVLSLDGPGGLCPVSIRNAGSSPVWLVGVLDGSEEGTRYPLYRPRVLRDGEVVAEPGPPEDPLVGPVREQDLRLLAPGESFDPTGGRGLATFNTFAPQAPGAYVYELTFSTDAEPERFLGRFNQDRAILERLALVPRLTVTATTEIKAGPPTR